MTLLIDGHNLIGAGVFGDIHLSDEDDEAKLVARLKVWRSRIRRNMVVFFDRGISGGRDHRMSGGGVEVVFATSPTEADDLIRRRLHAAGRNTVLVSNDDALAREADRNGVERWRGHEFMARMALRLPDLPVPEEGEEWDVRLSKAEVEEWMEVFRAARRAKRSKRTTLDDAVSTGEGTKAQRKKARGKAADTTPGAKTGVRRRSGKPGISKTEASKTGASKTGSSGAGTGSTEQRKAGPVKPPKQSQRKTRKAARDRNRLQK